MPVNEPFKMTRQQDTGGPHSTRVDWRSKMPSVELYPFVNLGYSSTIDNLPSLDVEIADLDTILGIFTGSTRVSAKEFDAVDSTDNEPILGAHLT